MGEDRTVVSVFLSQRAALLEYAAARAGREHAEDVVQEAFVKVSALQGQNYDWAVGPRGEIRNLNSYLFAIVRNLCIDRLRGAVQDRARRSPEEALDNVACCDRSPEDNVAARQQLTLMSRAIETLPPRTATAFKMVWLDGSPLRMIAAKLGISIARADQLVRQAEAHLSRELPDFKPRSK